MKVIGERLLVSFQRMTVEGRMREVGTDRVEAGGSLGVRQLLPQLPEPAL